MGEYADTLHFLIYKSLKPTCWLGICPISAWMVGT